MIGFFVLDAIDLRIYWRSSTRQNLRDDVVLTARAAQQLLSVQPRLATFRSLMSASRAVAAQKAVNATLGGVTATHSSRRAVQTGPRPDRARGRGARRGAQEVVRAQDRGRRLRRDAALAARARRRGVALTRA
mmetsp:Transcript_3811/g.11847  ORF Transcript_3811/g.11847 Transcript_3811/m.11847 type:complete len:133 (-) Transcript_3811:138-536(-)